MATEDSLVARLRQTVPRAVGHAPRASGPERPRRVALAIGLLALVALAHYRVAFLGETFVARDALEIMLPAHAARVEALRAGRVPEWSDAIGTGAPFAANPLHGVTYPPYWLAALLPAAGGGDLMVLLHIAFGALGVAALARRLESGPLGAWLAGGVFATCGYVASMPANNNAQLLCWVPWVAWAADRVARPAQAANRWRLAVDAALLAAAFAAQLIVGEPAHVATSALLAAIVLVVRAERRTPAIARAAAAMAGSIPLAAASLLPALPLLGWSTRAGGLSAEQRFAWSMAPVRMLEWIWPGLLGAQVAPGGLADNLSRALAPSLVDAAQRTTWAFSVYIGIPALALAAWAASKGRHERWLLVASALFVLLALGPATPLAAAFSRVFPPAGLARYPEKYLVGCMVVWSALAGVGLGRLARRGADRSLVLLAAGGTLLLAVAVAAATAGQSELVRFLAERTARATLPFEPVAALRRSLVSGGTAVVVSVTFTVLLAYSTRLRHVARTTGLVALLLGDLVLRGWSVNPTTPRAILESPPRILAGVPVPPPPALRPRIWIHSRRGLRPADLASASAYGEYTYQSAGGDIPTLHGFAALPGASPAQGRALQRLLALEAGPWLLGVDYAVVADGLVDPGEYPVVARDTAVGASVLRARDPRPRAFVAPRWIRSPDPIAALPQVTASGDRGLVVVEGPGDLPARDAQGAPVGACEARSTIPERVELACSSQTGGTAVLLDTQAPGWRATVDGAAVEIETVDAAFRGVRVGPGEHRIEFRYETPYLRLGAAIAAVGWAAWLVVLLAALRRSSRVTTSPAGPRAG